MQVYACTKRYYDKKGDKWEKSLQTDYLSYLLECNKPKLLDCKTSYKILSNILARLIPYEDEITGDHQCGFRSNRSTPDQIFYNRQILEKKVRI
jgi:hypothetical protein